MVAYERPTVPVKQCVDIIKAISELASVTGTNKYYFKDLVWDVHDLLPKVVEVDEIVSAHCIQSEYADMWAHREEYNSFKAQSIADRLAKINDYRKRKNKFGKPGKLVILLKHRVWHVKILDWCVQELRKMVERRLVAAKEQSKRWSKFEFRVIKNSERPRHPPFLDDPSPVDYTAADA